jgi:hypothetical protein
MSDYDAASSRRWATRSWPPMRQEPNELLQFPVGAATGPARTVPFARLNGPAGQRPGSRTGGKIGRLTDGAALNDGTRITTDRR